MCMFVFLRVDADWRVDRMGECLLFECLLELNHSVLPLRRQVEAKTPADRLDVQGTAV